MVHFLKPGASASFADYSRDVFCPYISSQLKEVSRVDIIWDRYFADSLKGEIRAKRGEGKRRRVEATTKLPKNWQDFLKSEENKEELFHFLSKESVKLKDPGQIISTLEDNVLHKEEDCSLHLSPCNHEEADTRIFIHLADCIQKGHSNVMIRTVDTDVVVLAISAIGKVSVSELWIAFGTGKSFRYLEVHEIAKMLGPEKSAALPMFHAFTGCDTVSFFHGKGKKSAWLTWKSMNTLTSTFLDLLSNPSTLEANMSAIERFVIVLYDRTSSEVDVNHARKVMFAQKGRDLERIPPTRDALFLHLKRAVYGASFI